MYICVQQRNFVTFRARPMTRRARDKKRLDCCMRERYQGRAISRTHVDGISACIFYTTKRRERENRCYILQRTALAIAPTIYVFISR